MKKEVDPNFLVKQYDATNPIKINHSYLREQFEDYKQIFERLEQLVAVDTDYTLGRPVAEFEESIRRVVKTNYALGVNSGTDALFLSLKALGIKRGDEVITVPYTFFATTGAIAQTDAVPVYVDIGEDYNLNPDLKEKVISPRTKAILPVHWSGNPCDMDAIMDIAKRKGLHVVEDACQAIGARYKDRPVGSFGDAAAFSMHPLKNLNVWGDGGFLTTNSKELYDQISLLRNHGLKNRNESVVYGYNSRLDSVQAIVASQKLKSLEHITSSRIRNADFYDTLLGDIPQVTIPKRDINKKQVYHLYIIKVQDRDSLQQHLINKGIDAKVHYPIPLHLQEATRNLGYKKGDFPVAESICDSILSLPVHEYLKTEDQKYVASKIIEFYSRK